MDFINLKNKNHKKPKSNLYIIALLALIYTHKINERNICQAVKID